MQRTTYAARCPLVECAVGISTSRNDVHVGFTNQSDMILQYDGSNCGVVNLHYPRKLRDGSWHLLAAWVLTIGFGYGFPTARSTECRVVVDGVHWCTLVRTKQDCISSVVKGMARISGPVHGNAIAFARWIHERFPTLVSFGHEVLNPNSGNLICSADITCHYSSMDADVLADIVLLAESVGVTEFGIHFKPTSLD